MEKAKERFFLVIPSTFKFEYARREKQDYMRQPFEVAAKRFKAWILYPGKSLAYKENPHYKRLPIVHRTGLGYIRFLLRNRDAIFFANSRIWQSFILPYICPRHLYMSHTSLLPHVWWKRQVFKFFAKRFKAIKVSNPFEKEELIKIGVPAKRITYIPLSIDYTYFSKKVPAKTRALMRKQYDIKKEDTVLLFLANVRLCKNPYTVIRALKLLKDRGKNVKMLVVGRDLLEEEKSPSIAHYAKENGVFDRVILAGPQQPENLLNFISMADIGVNSSKHEGQCLVAYELASAGLPLCLSRIGSFTSVFTDSVLFFDTDDDEMLAKNITTYMDHPSLVKRHVAKNRALVKRHCDYKVVSKQLDELFSTL